MSREKFRNATLSLLFIKMSKLTGIARKRLNSHGQTSTDQGLLFPWNRLLIGPSRTLLVNRVSYVAPRAAGHAYACREER